MKSQWMLSVLIVGSMAIVGCQSNHAVVRGQNPGGCAPGANGPMGPMPGPMGSMPGSMGSMPGSMGQMAGPMPGPMYYNGPAGADPAMCQQGQCRPEWAKYPSECPEDYHFPKHHHTFDYRQPKNLVYPPQNQPAAAVVYPYYTCKGPSDFFMK